MIIKFSPAKVNLYLRVLAKRSDGYHDIQTLMQKISLSDEMIFSPIEHGIVIDCPDSILPENEDNIVYKAAYALLSHIDRPTGIHITIRKKIPIAAGLGGGSSNAATTLITLNEMMRFPFTIDDLMKIGSRIGADVPFFIFGNTAWATGIGDQLSIAENIPPLWFVLINPSFEISTAMVYEKLNFRLTKEMLEYRSFPPYSYSLEDIAKGLYNDLEKVAFNLYPELRHLKELLIEEGAHGALMSGSGPTVFGIFTEEDKAAQAEKSLRKLGAGVWAVIKAHSI